MRSRLEDLMATAERQLAVRSYEAAIDTYRTALSEPGGAEAGVAEKLEAAEATRDAARGIIRPTEPESPPEVAVEPEPPPASVEPAAAPEPEPEPTPAPSFYLVEDDPARLEHTDRRRQHELDVEPLSILDPTPPPDLPNPLFAARVAVAALIFLLVCGVVWLLK